MAVGAQGLIGDNSLIRPIFLSVDPAKKEGAELIGG